MVEPDSPKLKTLRPFAVGLAVLGVFPLAAVIKWAPLVSWLPRAGVEWAISGVLFALVCLALSRWAGDAIDRMMSTAHRLLMSLPGDEFAAWMAFVVLVGSIGVALFCYGGQPAGGDDLTQLFQARILASGHFAARADAPPEFFSGLQTAVTDGRWYSQFPIGGAAALSLGALIGAAWLINPILAAWTAASTYRFAARVTDELTARIATVMFAASPFVLLMSGSQMNHVGALAFTMWGLASLAHWTQSSDERETRWAAFRVGFAFAAAATFRPYDAVVMAAVVGIFQLIVTADDPGRRRSFAWQLAGGALPIALLLYANAATTGDPLLFAYDALNAAGHRPGFHRDPMGIDFTPLIGLHHASLYVLLLNWSLLSGPLPAVVLLVVSLWLIRPVTRWHVVMAALIAATIVAYGAYWAESLFVGPRFLYGVVPLLLIVIAALPSALLARAPGPFASRSARLLLPLMLLFAWLLPPGIAQYQGAWQLLGQARARSLSYREPVDAVLRATDVSNALVFLPDNWHSQLTARLRAIGAPALQAESMVRELDACVLDGALDNEDRIPGPPGRNRVARVARLALFAGQAVVRPVPDESRMLAFIPRRMLSAECTEKMRQESDALAFDAFLPRMRFDRDGRLTGDVIYARDLGLRNQLLIGRFGDRTWYRFRYNGGAAELVPYSPDR